MTTTTLVRVPVARFSRLERSESFTTLAYPNANDGEVLARQGFLSGLDTLDGAATTKDVHLRLNQTFRIQNVAPTGAVVPPATRSQHLIGRAVDLNIVDGQTVVTTAMFLDNTAPQKAKNLVQAAKDAGLKAGSARMPQPTACRSSSSGSGKASAAVPAAECQSAEIIEIYACASNAG